MSFNSRMSKVRLALFGPDRETLVRNYLNRSVSIYDLERRQREIDQGKFR